MTTNPLSFEIDTNEASRQQLPGTEKNYLNITQPSLTRFQRLLKNPWGCLFLSFLFAWFYAVLPDFNYWFYYLFKNQFWAVMTLIECQEMMTINLPDVSDFTYFTSYLVGFCIPIIIHTIAYWLGDSIKNNLYLASVSGVIAVLAVYIIYGIDCFLAPEVSDAFLREKDIKKLANSTESSTSDPNQQSMSISQDNGRNRTISDELPSRLRTESVNDCRRKYRTIFAAVTKDVSFSVINTSSLAPTSHLREEKETAVSIESGNEANNSSKAKTMSSFQQFLNRLYLWKYYFPRYWYLSTPHHPMNTILLRKYDRRILWGYATLYSILYCCNYIFLIFLTIKFQDTSRDLKLSISLFLVFIFGTTLFRFVLKSLGSLLDSTKIRSVSMYFITEVGCLLFYYTFYRVLFESIDQIYEFLCLQCLHLASEWLLYVLRTSYGFYMITEWIILRYGKYWWWIQQPRFSFPDWQKLMTLDFAIRIVVFVASTFAI